MLEHGTINLTMTISEFKKLIAALRSDDAQHRAAVAGDLEKRITQSSGTSHTRHSSEAGSTAPRC